MCDTSTSASVVSGEIRAILWNGVKQDAAIQRKQVHIPVQFMVDCSKCFTAIVWRRWAEPILRAIAESFYNPGQLELLDDRFHPGSEFLL